MTEERKIEYMPKVLTGLTLAAGVLLFQTVSPCKWIPSCDARTLSPDSSAGAQESSDAVLVTVNGTAITRADVNEKMRAAIGGQGVPDESVEEIQAQLAPRIEEMLVTRELLKQQADSEKFRISDAELEDAIDAVVSMLPPGASLDDLKAELGLTEDEWRSNLADDLRIEKLLDTCLGEMDAPSDAEVEAFYAGHETVFQVPETVEARHILIAADPGERDAERTAKRQQAEEIRQRLTGDEPASFADVAAEVSDCPSAARGGALGMFARGQMVAAFEEAAFSQEPGVIGPIVDTEFGFHIIKVDDRAEAGLASLDEVRDAIEHKLRTDRQQEAFEAYLNELKSNASIEYPETPRSA